MAMFARYLVIQVFSDILGNLFHSFPLETKLALDLKAKHCNINWCPCLTVIWQCIMFTTKVKQICNISSAFRSVNYIQIMINDNLVYRVVVNQADKVDIFHYINCISYIDNPNQYKYERSTLSLRWGPWIAVDMISVEWSNDLCNSNFILFLIFFSRNKLL